MRRCVSVALGLWLSAIVLHAQTPQQVEREATAKAQAIAIGGGPEALITEIATELADLGRYEDKVLTGTYGPALKNFPHEAVEAFTRVDFEIQLNLLTSSWDRFAFPAIAPVLTSLYQSPPDDSAHLRDMALRRLYQLEPIAARPLMLAELQRGDLRVSMKTLDLLPDASFPDYEEAWARSLENGVLDERLDAAVRLERFGSSAVLSSVKRIYSAQGHHWSCDVRAATVNYLVRLDPQGSQMLVRDLAQCR